MINAIKARICYTRDKEKIARVEVTFDEPTPGTRSRRIIDLILSDLEYLRAIDSLEYDRTKVRFDLWPYVPKQFHETIDYSQLPVLDYEIIEFEFIVTDDGAGKIILKGEFCNCSEAVTKIIHEALGIELERELNPQSGTLVFRIESIPNVYSDVIAVRRG